MGNTESDLSRMQSFEHSALWIQARSPRIPGDFRRCEACPTTWKQTLLRPLRQPSWNGRTDNCKPKRKADSEEAPPNRSYLREASWESEGTPDTRTQTKGEESIRHGYELVHLMLELCFLRANKTH